LIILIIIHSIKFEHPIIKKKIRFLIDKSNSDFSTLIDLLSEGETGEFDAKLEGYEHQNKNTTWNIQRAEKLYYGNYSEEAYQLSRQVLYSFFFIYFFKIYYTHYM